MNLIARVLARLGVGITGLLLGACAGFMAGFFAGATWLIGVAIWNAATGSGASVGTLGFLPLYFGLGGIPSGAFVGAMVGLLRPRANGEARHVHVPPRPAGAA